MLAHPCHLCCSIGQPLSLTSCRHGNGCKLPNRIPRAGGIPAPVAIAAAAGAGWPAPATGAMAAELGAGAGVSSLAARGDPGLGAFAEVAGARAGLGVAGGDAAGGWWRLLKSLQCHQERGWVVRLAASHAPAQNSTAIMPPSRVWVRIHAAGYQHKDGCVSLTLRNVSWLTALQQVYS